MTRFYSAGGTDALIHAIRLLHDKGIEFLPCPDDNVTHLLLPTPSFDADGRIHGGGSLHQLLLQLPEDIIIIGGNLNRPELDQYLKIDLLKDEQYVARNAAITAHCAIRLAMLHLPIVLQGASVLVIGWGRIGKCLSQLLKQLGANVTVAARKEQDRAMLQALNYQATDIADIFTANYHVIFNTAPVMLLQSCPGTALKIDLASTPGISGDDVIHARGLPGKVAPESSGALIADTVLRLTGQRE